MFVFILILRQVSKWHPHLSQTKISKEIHMKIYIQRADATSTLIMCSCILSRFKKKPTNQTWKSYLIIDFTGEDISFLPCNVQTNMVFKISYGPISGRNYGVLTHYNSLHCLLALNFLHSTNPNFIFMPFQALILWLP